MGECISETEQRTDSDVSDLALGTQTTAIISLAGRAMRCSVRLITRATKIVLR
jgi:hypothetical protein